MTQHLDEHGAPCTRHAPASPDNILALALLGSSIPSFHHDVASKLQGLMMALDEIMELSESSDVRNTATNASETVRDLGKLITANRALVHPPRREKHPIRKLVSLAAERIGVRVQANLPTIDVDVGHLGITHAFALVLDLAAGPVQLGRTVDIAVASEAGSVALVVTGPPAALQPLPTNFSDVMALAAFALSRDGGELRCGPSRFTVRLPRVE